MVIRGTPKDIENYILVEDNKISSILQKQGFLVRYINSIGTYFIKTSELINFMERSD